jgi:hypothetical protein
MELDQSRINDLIARPSEGLNVEIKRWINPDEPEGITKIIKGSFAIRNRNGGFLIIGFDDKTLKPGTEGAPTDVRSAFNLDKVQGIISRYASEPFEVKIGFGSRDGQEFPVIAIPDGVRTPVVARRDLLDAARKTLIREGDVFFRTLGSNGTPSSSCAKYSDWSDILEICFENREADIGRFLRRHLSGKEIVSFVESMTGLRPPTMPPPPNLKERAHQLLIDGDQRLQTALKGRSLSKDEITILNGLTWKIALVFDPPRTTAVPDTNFFNAAMGANPQLTGWPIWLDSRGASDDKARPIVTEKGWEALIISLDGWSKHIDFMRLDPKGEFYLSRVLPDDVSDRVQPGTALDPILIIIRVAEAIAVGLSIAKALGWTVDARLGFGFRWIKLSGRELTPWANPLSAVQGRPFAHDNEVETYVELSLDTPVSAIAPFVEEATRDLFLLFDGYTVPSYVVEEWTKRLLERRL